MSFNGEYKEKSWFSGNAVDLGIIRFGSMKVITNDFNYLGIVFNYTGNFTLKSGTSER